MLYLLPRLLTVAVFRWIKVVMMVDLGERTEVIYFTKRRSKFILRVLLL